MQKIAGKKIQLTMYDPEMRKNLPVNAEGRRL